MPEDRPVADCHLLVHASLFSRSMGQPARSIMMSESWSIHLLQGWVEASLATSSLLKAVGIASGVAGATAATAGIKWILKVRSPFSVGI